MIGQTVLHYTIESELGRGAMGIVYRAHDTQLDRDVAIKVLSAGLAADDERRARFEREARLLAAINHPHVATLFGVEQTEAGWLLILELVGGETLADRLARGPLPVDEAIDVFVQIADALETAHESGIVHRDLKAANVGLTEDGDVKVLDFGLAKSAGVVLDVGSVGETSASQVTQEGQLVGTPATMSPEQMRGKPIDRRADIWAFGCLFVEVLSGRSPFPGKSVADMVAAVLESEPDLSRLPTSTPFPLRQLIARCLVKDPRKRLRDIGEARVLLETLREDPGAADRDTPVSVAGRRSTCAPRRR